MLIRVCFLLSKKNKGFKESEKEMKVIGKETGIIYFEGATHAECTGFIASSFRDTKTFVLFKIGEFESNKIATFDRLEKIKGVTIDRNLSSGVFAYEGVLPPVDAKHYFSKKVQKAQALVNIKKIQNGFMPEAMLIMKSF